MKWKCFINYILHDAKELIISSAGFVACVVILTLIAMGIVYLISWIISLFGIILLPETIVMYSFGLFLLIAILGIIINYFHDVYLKCKL